MTDLEQYHISIGKELMAAKDRVRALIHPKVHWGEDGRFKEDILKDVLTRHLPDTLGVYSGFVRTIDECVTNQLDVLISDRSKGFLFRTKDFCITTPSNVYAVVEVKTRLRTPNELEDAANTLGNNIHAIRRAKMRDLRLSYDQTDPWCGLFTYDLAGLDPQDIVDKIAVSAKQDFTRVIQFACFGPDIFVRFWSRNDFVGWEAYELKDLAFAYFLGNLLWQNAPLSVDSEPWFPIKKGKDSFVVASRAFDFKRE